MLHNRIENLAEAYRNSVSNEIYDIGDVHVLGLCRIIEEILQHGMKQPNLGVVFWAYVRVRQVPFLSGIFVFLVFIRKTSI